MKIDWAALGIVAVVSVLATVLFVVLLAGGIRLVAANLAVAGPSTNGHRAAAPRRAATGGSRAARVLGYVLLGFAGLLVVLGIYLILPFAN